MDQNKFEEIITLFENARDKNNDELNMHYLMIKDRNNTFLHTFNGKSGPSDIRSISKTVLTLTLGKVIEQSKEGKYPKIDEESFVYPIIKKVANLTNLDNEEKLKKLKIKHLLTHTIGYDEMLLMRDDIKDKDFYTFVEYLINYPIKHEPGEHYLYSNAGFYLLGVFLQEFIREDLLTFINRELFEPLDIVNYEWEMYGDYIAGATRLWLLPEDLIKFGEVFLNDGYYKDDRIISHHWIDKMLQLAYYTEMFDNPEEVFRRYAYGYGIWLAKEPFYFGYGTDGQTLVVLPEKDVIIVTLAEQVDMEPIEKILSKVIKSLNHN